MTTDHPSEGLPSTPSRIVFSRYEERTHLDERVWPLTKMRALSASYADGLNHVSFITFDNSDKRLSTMIVHRSALTLIGPNDTNCLTLQFLSKDGAQSEFMAFGVTLDDLAEALATAISMKNNNAEINSL